MTVLALLCFCLATSSVSGLGVNTSNGPCLLRITDLYQQIMCFCDCHALNALSLTLRGIHSVNRQLIATRKNEAISNIQSVLSILYPNRTESSKPMIYQYLRGFEAPILYLMARTDTVLKANNSQNSYLFHLAEHAMDLMETFRNNFGELRPKHQTLRNHSFSESELSHFDAFSEIHEECRRIRAQIRANGGEYLYFHEMLQNVALMMERIGEDIGYPHIHILQSTLFSHSLVRCTPPYNFPHLLLGICHWYSQSAIEKWDGHSKDYLKAFTKTMTFLEKVKIFRNETFIAEIY